MTTDVLDIQINSFYLRKIKNYCNLLDVEGTGFVTKENFEAFIARYKELAKHETIRERQMERKMMKLWDYYFDETSKRTNLTPKVFAQCLAYRGTDQLISSATMFTDLLFDLIDVNADGVINQNEFVALHKLLRGNEETAARAFKGLDTDGNGVIGYDEFANAVIKYFRPDIEEETADAEVFGPLPDEE